MAFPVASPIMVYGQPCLRGIAQAVPPDYPLAALQNQLNILWSSLTPTGAYSISATQIGWMARLFIAHNWTSPLITDTQFINPVVTSHPDASQKTEYADGCISIPGYGNSVYRYNWIELMYETLVVGPNGLVRQQTPNPVRFEGHDAYVVQHELDHLDGVLFIDHVENNGGSSSLGCPYGLSNLNDGALANIANGNYTAGFNTLNRTQS